MIKNWQASSFSYCPVSKDASLPALYKVGLFSSEAKKVSREREQIIGFLLDNNNTWPMIPGPWTTRKKLFLKHISSPRFRLIKREVVNTLVKKSKMGDWFLFYMLGQNVDSMIFKEVRGPKLLYQSVHRSLVNFRRKYTLFEIVHRKSMFIFGNYRS